MYWYRITLETSSPALRHVFHRQFSGRSAARNYASSLLSRATSAVYLNVEYCKHSDLDNRYFPFCSVFTWSCL